MATALLDSYSPTTVGSLAVDTLAVRRRAPQLRLVPTGADVVEPAAAPLRLTRRGRLAITCTVALAIVIALFSAVSAMTPAGAASTVVVQPGQTLTSIALTELPELPLSQAVTDIQRANGLSTSSIAVGQELVIPGR